MALVICLGTANTYVAATSRLGYALARDGALPRWLVLLDSRGVPGRSIVSVGAYAGVGLAVAYVAGWTPERLLIVPNSLGIATYIIGTAAGVRLLGGAYRWLAGLSLALCLMILPFAGAAVVLPAGVAAAVWLTRAWRARP
jgi:amino acid efflux transporter